MDDKKVIDSHKLRGGRLARRAKSFKDDFLGKLNQMRSQSGTRSGSPNKMFKSKAKTISSDLLQEKTSTNKSAQDTDSILHSAKQLSSALRYFQDVVQKDILEMLPGSVNVVLETVIMIHSSLRKALVDEQSSLILSATNQVYQSLANLIKWADGVLLHGSQTMQKDDAFHIIQSLRDAIKTLVQLSIDKLENRGIKSNSNAGNQNRLHAPKSESPHRNSLPDIPLTPREREILQKTQFSDAPYFCTSHMHHSASSDSILGKSTSAEVTSPPPKPPLPDFREISYVYSPSECTAYGNDYLLESAPPLPPKKKPAHTSQIDHLVCASDSVLFEENFSSFSSEFSCQHFLEVSSPFSQSPENSTPLSKSSTSSLDSNLNYSTDELSSERQQCLNKDQMLYGPFESSLMCTSSQSFSCEFTSNTTESMSSLTIQKSDSSNDINGTLKHMNRITTSSEHVTTLISARVIDPPALPVKLRNVKCRAVSQYDNVPQFFGAEFNESPAVHHEIVDNTILSDAFESKKWITNKHAPTCPHHKGGDLNEEIRIPPPLPPKKKTVMAYMQMFGSYSQPSENEFLRHSLHTYNIIQENWQQMELSFMPVFSDSLISSHMSLSGELFHTDVIPPALPPKKNRMNYESTLNSQISESLSESIDDLCSSTIHSHPASDSCSESSGQMTSARIHEQDTILESADFGALEEQDVSHYIVFKKPGEEGPDVRAGTVDSLIVQATKADKNDFLYQEAFLTTYRTFISPFDLVKKLLYRYTKFIHMSDMRQRAARNAFSLLVRVVSDLCMADVQIEMLTILMDFVVQLVSRGELMLARALRTKVVEKCEARQKCLLTVPVLLPSMAVSIHQSSLLDFKSEGLAEQMTLLDADLFQKIEIPEVLLWAKEQKEELSPNLTKFTEHFNKMSFWARSRILEQEEVKDRERFVMKFIKIMKHLRKLNNFNSYLAILSALDSAPIRRLEWQRNITEGLKEYCALIDSSSSFRAYRQALADTIPPCIPYIGLILQDLTFVHIGNNDWFMEGSVNFSKRWQQFNILDNMRRFKNSQYPFKRNDNIIAFFNNFDDYLCEEAMWQISETIKPRGGKKKNVESL